MSQLRKSIEKPWVANRKLDHQFSCGVIFGLSSSSVLIFTPPKPDCLCYELHIKNGQCVCANNIYVVKVSPARWVLGSVVGSAGSRPLVGELQLGRKIILPSHHQRSRPVCSSHSQWALLCLERFSILACRHWERCRQGETESCIINMYSSGRSQKTLTYSSGQRSDGCVVFLQQAKGGSCWFYTMCEVLPAQWHLLRAQPHPVHFTHGHLASHLQRIQQTRRYQPWILTGSFFVSIN